MTKFLTTLLGAAALLGLGACSSEPSDLRPNQKVSVDAVAAGSRKTGLYPASERADATPAHGHGAEHGAEHGAQHSEGHTPGEVHGADAAETSATGHGMKQSTVAEPAVHTEAAAPEAEIETPAAQTE